ncbi:MAG: hypothetical protein JWM54_127 [Acidobacteriaceae bacterium]|nr:hypothetical protein [Acidobacteriaceae bacterium]
MVCAVVAATLSAGADQSSVRTSVRVEPVKLQGPRVLNDQTRDAVIRDYLEAWQSLGKALEANRTDLLDRDFVGTAKDKVTQAIHEQVTAGITTRYVDRSHDLQIVFYSPEGLSIQLVDKVDYDVQVLDHGKIQSTQQEHAHYVVVLSPSEVRWRVRILQAGTVEH